MPIPPEIEAIINRLNQELNSIEQKSREGSNLVRAILSIFPNNAIIIQYFAYLNAALLFVETSRRQIQITVELVSPDDVTATEIQEAGEDLGSILGRALETKIRVERIINNLEELQ
ncbi:hypothetical protein ACE1CI_04785 [Aerosakkonemataceae cyanobacterium BLCC-F50]|uniref:Restriction endonuclease subunit S n=1 Tax=Floridaenema flaviceps BLCC-F50 TaxID=3153642 RepID=A0ABV4XKN4_9CYAN